MGGKRSSGVRFTGVGRGVLCGKEHHGTQLAPRRLRKVRLDTGLDKYNLNGLQIFGGHRTPAGAVLLQIPGVLVRKEGECLLRQLGEGQCGAISPGGMEEVFT